MVQAFDGYKNERHFIGQGDVRLLSTNTRLMAKHIAPIVAECVNGQDDPEKEYFACSGRVHYREHVPSPLIQETGNMATGIPRPQRGFTGGL